LCGCRPRDGRERGGYAECGGTDKEDEAISHLNVLLD
jgi:hypothetical protein